jgi:peptidoglycan/LPS O-acetylase OafA/YrhL
MYFLNLVINSGVSSNSGLILLSIIAFVVAFLLSIISYHLFELKIQSLKDVVTSEGFFPKVRRKLGMMLGLRTEKVGS